MKPRRPPKPKPRTITSLTVHFTASADFGPRFGRVLAKLAPDALEAVRSRAALPPKKEAPSPAA